MATQPANLLDANIFYPEPPTLTFSDAMFVESSLAAPLLWLGARPMLVHNVMLLGAIAMSGFGMFVFVRHLTASRSAALVAGVIFSFVPYRFEHFMHMELQWTMWMPWAFWGMHRTLETGRMRYGLVTGLFVSAQMLSCVYYGVFLGTLLGLSTALFLICDREVTFARAALALGAGGLLALVICGAYAVPYLRNRDNLGELGERAEEQVAIFSARPSSYAVATPNNWLYGGMNAGRGRAERRLFPGAIATLLALTGLLLRRPSNRQLVYLLMLVAAFEMSLGFAGYSYGVLYHHIAVYRGLRAAARLGIFVVMCLAVLAAYGYQSIVVGRSARVRLGVLAALVGGMLVEYSVTLSLVPYPNTPPRVYRLLAAQPRGVVAEFPVPAPDALPGQEARHSYMSTFHWFPLVNGYSGVFPSSYLHRLGRLHGFPDAASLDQLHSDGVRYVVVHAAMYRTDRFVELREAVERTGRLVELIHSVDSTGEAVVYRFY